MKFEAFNLLTCYEDGSKVFTITPCISFTAYPEDHLKYTLHFSLGLYWG